MELKIVIIIVVVLLLILFLIYNYLVKLSNRCNNAWSNIDNQLKRRIDLIPNLVEVTPNLVETVKGYAKHESETLIKVVNERNKVQNMSSLAKEEDKISSSVKSLFAVAENYPDLKANKLFQNLQVELVGTEDKIAFARQFYNDTVLTYNNKVEMVPSNIVAGIFKFKKATFFEASEEDKKTPEVKF